MAKGTEKNLIVEDLRETYQIEVKEIFLMSTKFRPMYLIVTDPAITLEYLNKTGRVIENTRVTWEQIIQCHRCQAWGHATANSGRPPKCAGDHLTNTCVKTRETPATCANCHGDYPANYTKCEAYLERASRLEERRLYIIIKKELTFKGIPKINISDNFEHIIIEPTGPPIIFHPSPTRGFSTEYTRKFKNKCRLKHSQYDRIFKLTSPKSVKAKIKRTGQKYVSTNTLELFQDSDNETRESKAPHAEFPKIRPSNDPQTTRETVNTENIAKGDTNATRKLSVADSGDSIEYHDSVESLNDT
ncbi:unnamed protein product [Psylliodes chrysocephalus]|uniref:Pre-C2HC domain-containing protein n=1 Tax=Psylliodes chrysocephalus TaxID=3402493 RepID=A0A9P0CQ35_9CUCU|nr:unnamed protein product [Psylliodes chrysocephala]